MRERRYTARVERLPLLAELLLPAKEPRELRAACDPARPLAPAEQIALHEDLSAVQGGDRIGRIELRVREAWRRSYLRELVTGHAGCGKSTELLRLVAELRKPKQGKAFHVVYLDVYDYLNPHEVRLPQILMALLVALSEEPRWDLKQTRTAPVLWIASARSSAASAARSARISRTPWGCRCSVRCSGSI